MIRHCSRCREENDTNGRYCRRCRANYMRNWRRTRHVNFYRNINSIASCETSGVDPELSAAVADLDDEFARAG